jgi:2-polyprenyl-6-hydroxyphenyl methylase/3-demethylubiquinone-9 3-methyltransferase
MGIRRLLNQTARQLVDLNIRVSRWESRMVARIAPRVRGEYDFTYRVVPGLLKPGLRVLDVGGGRSPTISAAVVRQLGLHVVGLDISAAELNLAPPGAYAETIVGDVAETPIPGQFDLILSDAVLEHVRDNRRAVANLAACLAPGGTMAHFVPCRNAPFALLNRWLGNWLAKKILLGIYPERQGVAGFPAYYDQCVPSRLAGLCRQCGLEVVELTPYFVSDYCEFFAPAYTMELARQSALRLIGARDFAETFVLVARKYPHLPSQ